LTDKLAFKRNFQGPHYCFLNLRCKVI